MSPERFEQIETLYNDALALEPNARNAFLDRACGTDGDLRQEIESLLTSERSNTCLDTDAIQFAAESLAQQDGAEFMGRMLGRYQLLSLVGRGGMGEVYCGVDTRLNRLVAIKVLPAYMTDSREWSERLEQEARAGASLNHPHICTLYDLGTDGGMHYLVFEYLIGELLSDRLAKNGLPLPEALRYAIQIADALVTTHQEAIIHCDLKPRNIMLTKAGVKLLDFGIAELRYASDARVNDAVRDSASGTLAYMAPEQIERREKDTRTDIFGFGLVLYQMVTGRPAFLGNDQASLIQSILNDTPAPASHYAPKTPPALDFLLARCLAKEPSERWQSICDVLFMLKWIAA